MKISVVVPVYNAERYLEECVKSILQQTYTDFELFLVDDGSTDNSSFLCDCFSQEDARVHVLHKPNGGVSSARNQGISIAEGEYLSFVDADDWLEPNYLAELANKIVDADLAVCSVEDRESWKLTEETVSMKELRAYPSRYAKHPYINYSVNKLYRKAIIDTYQLTFPETMRRGEDAVFVASYLEHCRNASVSSKVLYHYRNNERSAMHCFDPQIYSDEAFLMSVQYDLFHSTKISQEEENAFRLWEYGKILAVLRDISFYAPCLEAARCCIKNFCESAQIKSAFLLPPQSIGKRYKVYIFLICHGWYTLLIKMLLMECKDLDRRKQSIHL